MNISNLKVIKNSPGAGLHMPAESIEPTSAPAVPSDVEGWEPKRLDEDLFPDDREPGVGIPPTIENLKYLLDGNRIVARYDVIKKRSEVVIPGLRGVSDNVASVSITHVKSLMAMHGMPTGDARALIDAIANENPYNPVATWITSKPWDGKDRLPEIYGTIHTVFDYPPQLKEAIMYCWLLSAVAAALKHNFSTRLILTLAGPQSIGKTRWCLSLVPDPLLRDAVVKIDHHFEGGAKDQIITAMRHWIVELGEVESSFRKDQERLKGILTRDRDIIRIPYAQADSEWPRRTIFLASANGSDFLSDPSGSTRWGVIAVEAIDYEHSVDMQQLYAQLAVDLEGGKKWWFDKDQEAILEAWNERHQATSLIREAVSMIVDMEGDDTDQMKRMTASEVLAAAAIERPTTAQARECGSILRAKFGPPKKSSGIMRWELPLRPEQPVQHHPQTDQAERPKPTKKFD